MKRLNKIMLTGLMYSSFALSAQSTMSLSQFIDMADDYSLDVKKTRFEKGAADDRLNQAYAAYWPKVDLIAKTTNQRKWQSENYQTSTDQKSQVNAALLMTLYDFGVREARVDEAKFGQKSGEFKLFLQKEILYYDVFTAYVQYDFALQSYQLAQDYLTHVSDLQKLINQRVSAGFSAYSDRVRGELALSEAQSRVKIASQNLTDTRIALKNLTGYSPDAVSSLLSKPFTFHQDVNQITFNSTHQNPSLEMLRSNVNMNAAKVEAQQSERYPTIQLFGTYRADLHRENFPGSEAYVQMSVPLTDGGLLRARVSEAVNNHEAAKITLEMAYRDLDKRQQDFINLYQSAKGRLSIDLQSQAQAQHTLDIYQSEFSMGSRPLTDLINAQKDLLNINTEVLNDKMSAYIAVLSLYNLNGDTLNGIETLTK